MTRPARAHLVRSVLFQAAVRLFRTSALREFRTLRALERASPAHLAARQDARLRAIVRWAYDTVPYYRRVMDEAGVPPGEVRTAADLLRLPVLTRRDLKVSLEELVSRSARRRDLASTETSGATGVPVRFYRDRRTFPFDQASLWQMLAWAGVSPSDTMAVLRGKARPGTLWYRMTGSLYFPAELLFNQDAAATFALLERIQPDFLYGHPSRLHMLARMAMTADRPLRLDLQRIIYTGEQMREETRGLLSQAFGVPIFGRYGCKEFSGAVAQTCAAERWHITTEGLVVEIGTGGPGERTAAPAERGRVIVTDLRNRVMPFIRYEMADLAVAGNQDPCPCGCTWPVLGALEGRAAEYVETPTGRQVPCSMLQRRLSRHADLLWEYQLRQERPDELEIWVVPRDHVGPEMADVLVAEVRDLLGPSMAVRVVPVAAIPRESSEKQPVLKTRPAPAERT